MKNGSMVLCILGAMIGAGFASGRELMQFFSRWGQYSWAFVGCAAAMMTACMIRLMRRGECGMDSLFPEGKGARFCRLFLAALLIVTGGGMTAAAGGVCALILPIHNARAMGYLGTLLLAVWAARYPLRALAALGKILIPALLIAFALCFRLPGENQFPVFSAGELIMGLLQALAYAGMNVMLSAGVLCEAGGQCNPRGFCRGAAWSGGAIGMLLLLGNGVLLPHRESLMHEALPMVILLRGYGKWGYYLSAGVLYLAIMTTLIALLRGMWEIFRGKMRYPYACAGVVAGITGLIGFEEIVAKAYPMLGIISLLLIWLPKKKARSYPERVCGQHH